MSLKIEVPAKLIAQYPMKERIQSRMLVYNRQSQAIEHHHFYDIVNYFNEGDLFITNNTKVLRARLFGFKEDLSGAKLEILLIKKIDKNRWEVLIKPLKRIKPETKIFFDSQNSAVVRKIDLNQYVAQLEFQVEDWDSFLNKFGHIPLPPYIQRMDENEDGARYQTIYAAELGAVAAPTAGLHFDHHIINRLKKKKVNFESLTLHVGLGTFQPVTENQIKKGTLHREEYEVYPETVRKIDQAVQLKKRIVSVGTTVVRSLESASIDINKIEAKGADTDLFIRPGYQSKMIDCFLTNFHLPGSSLIYLVEAFLGEEILNRIYDEAVSKEYRFYSYGDCMLVL